MTGSTTNAAAKPTQQASDGTTLTESTVPSKAEPVTVNGGSRGGQACQGVQEFSRMMNGAADIGMGNGTESGLGADPGACGGDDPCWGFDSAHGESEVFLPEQINHLEQQYQQLQRLDPADQKLSELRYEYPLKILCL